MVTNASGSAIERSTCVSAAKLTTASASAIASGDRVAVLDPGVHEAVLDALEVLAPARVGELVEHGHVVAEVAHALAHEGRADEPGAAADEQPHASALEAARWAARPSCHGGQARRVVALGDAARSRPGAARGGRTRRPWSRVTAHSMPAASSAATARSYHEQ